ncbi:fumarylacetoacetate hydrolase family protein [Streptomyces sp. B6B3]|uniref:fumarylacetoacetate hydrolase family protein n=1 Tax=Streptomyces sp. B6B3 TaxID=3153570 RepID=UPI00325F9248
MAAVSQISSSPADVLPRDTDALLVGRLLDPEAGGPSLVLVRGDALVDVTDLGPTMADLLERPDAVTLLRDAAERRSWPLAEVLEATAAHRVEQPRLLAPVDLQVIKAAGVTFANSMLERVIEERAGGVAEDAEEIRRRVTSRVGERLESVRAGSPEAIELLLWLREQGMWSQYLEVGLGPDAEIFTKGPVLSAVGYGAPVGVAAVSEWNNPEPELVLAVTSDARIVGATLGNDVNLRDVEGRSALLLPQAKDNNAATALGPFLRLFDEGFGIDDVRDARITLTVLGRDGFELRDASDMGQISRPLESLVAQAVNRRHPYPDGVVLFTGTLFAPTADRGEPGSGFTHHEGDLVEIATPRLGALRNVVTTSEQAPEWDTGIRALYASLMRRGLLRAAT